MNATPSFQRPTRFVLTLAISAMAIFPTCSGALAETSSDRLAAALVFLSKIDGEAKREAIHPYDSELRTDWHYIPMNREGLAIEKLDHEGKTALWNLIGSCLSKKGVEQTKGAVLLEGVLREIEKSDHRDPGKYHLIFWGEPSAEDRWGWRFEGHHLSLNAAFKGNELTGVTPCFLGANPAKVDSGDWSGFRNLPLHEDLAREFITSLGKEKREKAVLPGEPGDVAGAREATTDPSLDRGLPVSELSEAETGQLSELLAAYAETFTPETRKDLGLDFQGALADPTLVVQWQGGMSPGEPHSYRICGKTLDIQFATRDADANHVHALTRIPGNDFGLGE